MQDTGPGKEENLTHWVIGAFCVVMIALGTYMSYGGFQFHSSDVELSARSRAADTPAETGQ
jgi:hypothetical protein